MPSVELSGVAVLILALLDEASMHPYQVFQALEQRQDTRLVRVNAGAVYHGVERLERDGFVEKIATERSGGRPERTRFQITDLGRATLVTHVRALLSEVHPAYPVFLVGLATATKLPRDEALAALATRRTVLANQLAELQEALDRLARDGLPRRYVLEAEAEAAQLRAEIAFVSGVLDDLAGGTLAWGERSTMPDTGARHVLGSMICQPSITTQAR